MHATSSKEADKTVRHQKCGTYRCVDGHPKHMLGSIYQCANAILLTDDVRNNAQTRFTITAKRGLSPSKVQSKCYKMQEKKVHNN